jgi:hypothetical protein
MDKAGVPERSANAGLGMNANPQQLYGPGYELVYVDPSVPSTDDPVEVVMSTEVRAFVAKS